MQFVRRVEATVNGGYNTEDLLMLKHLNVPPTIPGIGCLNNLQDIEASVVASQVLLFNASGPKQRT